ERAHAEIVRARASVRLSADDYMTFLNAQRAHGFGAIGHQAERSARRHDRLPHRATVARRNADFVRELARIADPEKTSRDWSVRSAHVAFANGEEREGSTRHVDVGDLCKQIGRASGR